LKINYLNIKIKKTMKKFFNFKTILATLVLTAMLAVPMVAFGQGDLSGQIDENLQRTGLQDDLGSAGNLPETIGNIITVVLGFLGIIFIVIIIYAGFIWLLSNGDDGKIKKAKGMIINSIIAVVIIFLAYAITTFVFSTIINNGIINPS